MSRWSFLLRPFWGALTLLCCSPLFAGGVPALLDEPRAELLTATEIAEHFGRQVPELVHLPGLPDDDSQEEVASLMGVESEDLSGVAIYRGRVHSRQGVALPVHLVTLPVRGTLEGATLALVVRQDGEMETLTVWGRPEVDNDESQIWGYFLAQFRGQGSLSRILDPTLSPFPEDIDEVLDGLEDSESPERQLLWALSRQRLLMKRQAYQRGRFRMQERLGGPSDSQILAFLKGNFAELEVLSGSLEPVLGKTGLRRYRQAAAAAQEAVDALAQDLKQDPNLDRAKRLNEFDRVTCRGCHTIPEHTLSGGNNLMVALSARLGELGVNSEFGRVGFDIWTIPGQEQACQAVADAVRAGLLLLGALDLD